VNSLALRSASRDARIVHVITGLGRGGAETALYRLLGCSPCPEDHHVISLTDRGYFGRPIEELGVSVTALGMRSGKLTRPGIFALLGELKKARPDLVQTWMYHANLLGGIAARLLGIPVLWGIRRADVNLRSNKPLTWIVIRVGALLSHWIPRRIVSCSERAARAHRRIGYADRFDIIPNGVDVSLYQTRNAPEVSWLPTTAPAETIPIVVGHVGRFDQQKDYPNLFEALSEVKRVNASFQLLAAGPGLEESNSAFRHLIVQHNLERNVLALGPQDDIPALLRRFDFFVLSSLGEGSPNALLEAMAAGVPCIATDVGDVASIVADTGWIVPPRNSSALASALVAAFAEPDPVRRARGQAARERVTSRFSLERAHRSYETAWALVARAKN
jgi:glycosyltransferase involved in cell wall biosynthesis